MFKFIKYLRSGLVLSAITAISLGLSAGPVNAQEEDDDKEKEASSREVLVECDKGQSVTQTLVQFANDTKPLEIIVRGECNNEPDGEVQIERDKVEIIGDEEVPGTIPFVLVDGARLVGFGDNLTLKGGLAVSAGMVEIGSETIVRIENGIGINSHSLLRIDTEASDDGGVGGLVAVNGQITVDDHSLLEVHREVSDGTVILKDGVRLTLQSSLYIGDAEIGVPGNTTVGNIELSYDSHAFLAGNVMPNNPSTTISCDSESRVWGDTNGFNVGDFPGDVPERLISCQGD